MATTGKIAIPVFPNDWSLIPPLIREGIDAWRDGCCKGMPGGFLTAVLENNLTEAVMRGDIHSLHGLAATVNYCYHKLPNECWGSPLKVTQWYNKHHPERGY